MAKVVTHERQSGSDFRPRGRGTRARGCLVVQRLGQPRDPAGARSSCSIAAAVAGLGVFWFKAAADSLRESKHPAADHRCWSSARAARNRADGARRRASARVRNSLCDESEAVAGAAADSGRRMRIPPSFRPAPSLAWTAHERGHLDIEPCDRDSVATCSRELPAEPDDGSRPCPPGLRRTGRARRISRGSASWDTILSPWAIWPRHATRFAARSPRPSHLRPRRLRRRRNLRHGARRSDPARARRRRRMASAEPVRRRIRGPQRDALAAGRRRLRSRAEGRLRDHRDRRGRRGQSARPRRSSSATTTAPPRSCRTARSSARTATPHIRSASSAAPGSSSSLARRSWAPARMRCSAISTWSRSRRSPTSSRWWTRTAGWRSRACARWRAPRSRACVS